MKTVSLIRDKTGKYGTFGKLKVDRLEFETGELADKGNAEGVSSIPVGRYLCRWTFSNRFKRMMYIVEDVPGRTGIRFHSANHMGDKSVDPSLKCELNGCIALGKARGMVEGQPGISGSRAAMKEFEDYMGGESFMLIVTEQYLETGDPGHGLA